MITTNFFIKQKGQSLNFFSCKSLDGVTWVPEPKIFKKANINKSYLQAYKKYCRVMLKGHKTMKISFLLIKTDNLYT
jgi:hypothetical protein